MTSKRIRLLASGTAFAALACATVVFHSDLLTWRRNTVLPLGSVAEEPIRVAVIVCVVYLVCVYSIGYLLSLLAVVENHSRVREGEAEGWEIIARSRFTIPVSVIAPMHNEEGLAVRVVHALLELQYPEFEVIVVNDGSTDQTLERLTREFALLPFDRFERRVLPIGTVDAVYRSETEPRLTVIDKVAGGNKAEPLNCGLNFARYRYVCCVDGDTIYERHALLSSMRLVLRDPGRIVGLTSQIVVATHPELPYRRTTGLLGSTLLLNFQHLEYLRSFLTTRLAWSRMNSVVCTSGAFMLYRRDALEEVGGYSPDFSCEDIELTFRVHEHFLRSERPYRILSMPEPVARTEGPDRLGGLISQRARWQRVMLETTWHYRRMAFNPRYRQFGLIGIPFCILSEVLAPFVEVLALTTLAAAALFGAVSWPEYGFAVSLMSLALASLSVLAVRLEDVGTRSYRVRDIVWLIVLSPLELTVYRPFLVWAHAQGVLAFFRGDKRWDRFERNLR
jgi:biofilm PGA synthesis N-glycosyltransferase PgaC